MDQQNNKPLFCVQGLSHSFGGLAAVSDFNLVIDAPAIWGIIGPNGAGKTTIFNLITGVYKPSGGSVKLSGNETRRPSLKLHNFKRVSPGRFKTYACSNR